MDWKTYIHSDPKILPGKPEIKETRLSVEFILGLFLEGWTEQQVLENYPTLNTRWRSLSSGELIQAVFVFAAECIKEDVYYTPLLSEVS
jgi:uncharacterized protein (DUF433 family)